MGASWGLIIGASLHWSSMFFFGMEETSTLLPSLTFTYLITSLSAVIALLIVCVPRILERTQWRSIVEILSIIAGGIVVVILCLPDEIRTTVIDTFWIGIEIALAINIASLVLLWGFAFASLDKKTAGKNAICTGVLSIILAFVILILSWNVGWNRTFIGLVFRIASAVILLTGRVTFVSKKRTFRKEKTASTARFVICRIFLGLGVGVFLGAPSSEAPSTVLALICMAFACGALIVLVRYGSSIYERVPVFPVAFAGLLLLPFLMSGLDNATALVPTIIWFSWIFISSFQLSSTKETFGLGEVRLSAIDKAALLVGWVIGLFIGPPIINAIGFEPLAFAACIVTLIWAAMTGLNVVYDRKENLMIERIEQERAQQDQLVLEELCSHYGLTNREAEVALLMTQGYSRPYICKTFSISDGTVRAHSSHVYTKLGIHKRDELLSLVRSIEDELRDLNAEVNDS